MNTHTRPAPADVVFVFHSHCPCWVTRSCFCSDLFSDIEKKNHTVWISSLFLFVFWLCVNEKAHSRFLYSFSMKRWSMCCECWQLKQSDSQRKQMYQHSRSCTSVTVLFVDLKVPVGFYCNILYIPVALFDTANCVLVRGLQKSYCCLKSNSVNIGLILYFVSIHTVTSFCATPLVEGESFNVWRHKLCQDFINEFHPVTS